MRLIGTQMRWCSRDAPDSSCRPRCGSGLRGCAVSAFCSVAECDRAPHARGLCGAHYQKWKVHGDPLGYALCRAPMEERFWARVDKTPDCWNWTASKTASGYGQIWDGQRVAFTHRYAYELLVGPIPEGLTIDHLCRNTSCCNPAHLEAVTQAENNRRASAVITQCVNGHSYLEGGHLYIRPDRGHRQCRTCGMERRAALRDAS